MRGEKRWKEKRGYSEEAGVRLGAEALSSARVRLTEPKSISGKLQRSVLGGLGGLKVHDVIEAEVEIWVVELEEFLIFWSGRLLSELLEAMWMENLELGIRYLES